MPLPAAEQALATMGQEILQDEPQGDAEIKRAPHANEAFTMTVRGQSTWLRLGKSVSRSGLVSDR